MLKFLALGIAAMLATIGGSYAAIQFGARDGGKTAASSAVVEEAVRMEQASIPIVRDGKVQGYVLAQVTYTAAAEDIKSTKALLNVYVNEAIFSTVYEEENFNFTALKKVEIADLAGRIRKAANGRAGRETVNKVLVESLMFLDQESVRCRRN